jgi:hypothetical protein
MNVARLHKSWQKLLVHWDATKLEWRDAVARDFEAQYLDELEPQLSATIERMRILSDVLNSACRDCQP